MKTKIENYTFNKTSKQVTFSDYEEIRLDAVLLITNATDSIVIFNFADPTKGGTVSANILTLAYDTSSMSDSDKLLIYYDDSERVDLTADLIETLQELTARLNVLTGMANAGTASLRVTPLNSVSTAVTGSLTTVTNLTNFGTSYPALEISHDMNNLVATIANINNVTM